MRASEQVEQQHHCKGNTVINIVTIEREYGCGGGEVARKTADRLGWKLWDELLTCEIARLSNCNQSEVESREERLDPLYYRLFKSILRGSFEGSLNVHRLLSVLFASALRDQAANLRLSRRIEENPKGIVSMTKKML